LDEICEESANMVIYDAIDWVISHKSLLLTSKMWNLIDIKVISEIEIYLIKFSTLRLNEYTKVIFIALNFSSTSQQTIISTLNATKCRINYNFHNLYKFYFQ